MPRMKNWQAALIAWLVATLVVGGGYSVFQLLRGRTPNLTTVLVAAALAGLYALYLAWRFRDGRSG